MCFIFVSLFFFFFFLFCYFTVIPDFEMKRTLLSEKGPRSMCVDDLVAAVLCCDAFSVHLAKYAQRPCMQSVDPSSCDRCAAETNTRNQRASQAAAAHARVEFLGALAQFEKQRLLRLVQLTCLALDHHQRIPIRPQHLSHSDHRHHWPSIDRSLYKYTFRMPRIPV